MSGLDNILQLFGGIGQQLQKAPAMAEQAQRIQMQRQQMDLQKQTADQEMQVRAQQLEAGRLEMGSKQINTLISLGTQLPTIQASPGFQQEFEKAFQNMGIDPKALPRDPTGKIDMSGLGGHEIGKLFSNPQFMAEYVRTPIESRENFIRAALGNPNAVIPEYLVKGIQYVQPPPPAGAAAAISGLIKGVQGGGDPVSSLSELQAQFTAGTLGANPATLEAATRAILDASMSPQARQAILTKGKEYEKLVSDTSNSILKGRLDQATLKVEMERLGLMSAQIKTELGKPGVQASEIAKNYAQATAASASAERSAVEATHIGLENNKLIGQMAWNQAHGLPIDPAQIHSLQEISASLSNQVKQWDGVKTATLNAIEKFKTNIYTNADEHHPDHQMNDEDKKTLGVLMTRYNNANQQLAIAMQRQQHAQNFTALPNGSRPFTAGGATTYKVGTTQRFAEGTYRKIKDGADNDPHNWVKVNDGGK